MDTPLPMPERDPRTAATFNSALALPPAEREAYLAAACADDDALACEVRALLAAHEAAGDFLKTDAPLSPKIEAELARLKPEEAGEMIGPYKLREQIGEGGFGTVWVADQEMPVRRRVALKIIKLGMDTKEVIARFEQERQALAMMDHPNIAKVFDAGATPTGRPFFVMELVRGIRITDYCDQANLPTANRLQLFIAVCHAVQHAHQKGIIHRDLKPSNILVTLHDGVPVPKVIDFGVAKATQGRLSEHTVYTQFEQMIGTPLYMSPEQAEMSGLDIDTRTDIYALGVLLYELLTGRTPFDPAEMMKRGLDEIRRAIREQEPPRPSTALSTMAADVMTAVAQHRQSDGAKLIGLLRGDLDWIVMKALEKDRTRRYDTANAFADDIQRHLTSEPVVARPPSFGYKVEKLFRRNKAVFAGGAAIAASLIIGISVSVWQARRANRALGDLRALAPALLTEARALVAREQFDEAIKKLDYAALLRPDSAEYLVAKGNLLQSQMNLSEAAMIYRAALKIQPDHSRAVANARLCDELLAAKRDDQGQLSSESLAKLHAAMQAEQRSAAELLPVARLMGAGKEALLAFWLERLKDLPIPPAKSLKERLMLAATGRLELDLAGSTIADLSPLAGMPLERLDLDGCTKVTDLTPLRTLPLRWLDLTRTSVWDCLPLRDMPTLAVLNLTGTKVVDLTPLRGLPLKELRLATCAVADITPLRGMPLEVLDVQNTRLTSLAPLVGMPLKVLNLSSVPALDFDALAGLPLETLYAQTIRIRDLGVLKGIPLRVISLWGSEEARNYAALSEIKTLEAVLLPPTYRQLPVEEIAAIAALRQHPTLKQIAADVMHGISEFASLGSKEVFWRQWDVEEAITHPLREAGLRFAITRQPDDTFGLTISDRRFRDLTVLQGAPISRLYLSGTSVSDLQPLAAMSLNYLDLQDTPVTDLSPLRGRPLEWVNLMNTQVRDITALKGAKLQWLYLDNTPVSDLSPLAACHALTGLSMTTPQKIDLAPLRGLPLTYLGLENTTTTDLSGLHEMKTLEKLVLPDTAADFAFLRELPRLNELGYEDGGCVSPPVFFAQHDFFAAIAHLRKSGINSTVTVLPDGTLSVSLQGQKFSDLAPLHGAKISILNLNDTEVTSLTALAGMPLRELQLSHLKITNLQPLSKLPLTLLYLSSTDVADLHPLRDMPLRELRLRNCRLLADLSPLVGVKTLRSIVVSGTSVKDVAPLLEIPALERVILPGMAENTEVLRRHVGLKTLAFGEISQTNSPEYSVQEFWEAWDAGERADLESLCRAGKFVDAAQLQRARLAKPRPGDDESIRRMSLCTILLAAGNRDGYRQECAAMLSRFQTNPTIYEAERTAKACLLGPDSGATPETIAALLVIAAPMENKSLKPWLLLTRGLAAYRAARWDEAQTNLSSLFDLKVAKLTLAETGSAAVAVLAMAEHRRGRTDEARAMLTVARTATAANWPKANSGYWSDWFIAHVLLQEAESLIDPKK